MERSDITHMPELIPDFCLLTPEIRDDDISQSMESTYA